MTDAQLVQKIILLITAVHTHTHTHNLFIFTAHAFLFSSCLITVSLSQVFIYVQSPHDVGSCCQRSQPVAVPVGLE